MKIKWSSLKIPLGLEGDGLAADEVAAEVVGPEETDELFDEEFELHAAAMRAQARRTGIKRLNTSGESIGCLRIS
jgi:hypothetical protein